MRTFFLVLGYSLVIPLLFAAIFNFLEPTSIPQNVFISNITEHQATVSYTTKKPTRAGILVSKDGKFPLLPIFANFVKDDGFYTTHHTTIPNLEPQTKYTFRIYQGLRNMYEGELSTATTISSPTSPSPVYGKVFTADKKPLAGAIVYFQVENGSAKSALLSTLTNSEGGWSIELANLRGFNITAQSKEMIVVEAGALGKGKAFTLPGQDKPWPDIIISQ